MPQSLSAVAIHLIFSTKDRRPLLGESISPRLHAYIATVARDLGCGWVHVGGATDHIHIAAYLPRTVAVATLVEKLKSSASRWLKQQDNALANFSWQRGYAVFSISHTHVEALVAYIDNQAEHHRKRTFEEEYLDLLKRAGVEFDPAYVLD